MHSSSYWTYESFERHDILYEKPVIRVEDVQLPALFWIWSNSLKVD